jgi:beta-phosphoglucomutase-like phosphatase (HAD superfamily)
MSLIKAVIFDMDGVLIDAKDWHYEALNKALALFGLEINRYDHLSIFDGLPTKEKLEMLSKQKGLPRPLHPFLNQMKQSYTQEIVFCKCKPNFHHLYALSSLKNMGYRLAVCSNSIRDSVEVMLGKAGILEFIEFYLSNQDVTLPKPHSEIYDKAIKKLGLQPQECLIVEDNHNGIKAAKESGAHVLEVQVVAEVNLSNILTVIKEINEKQSSKSSTKMVGV